LTVRFTIERLRTLVLVAAGLLVVALAAFLTVAHWKSRLNLNEIPKRLGVDIEQEANGVTYTQSRSGHTLFKIHASKVVQLKQDGRALLHDVHIELYGEDGSRVDTIDGQEFEYDQKNGKAVAGGPVEITLTRPGVAPAVAPNATAKQAIGSLPKASPLNAAAQSAVAGQIHVKTSGLTFDQQSGTAATSQRVEFSVTQGSGSSMGATFDSQNGQLVLDHAVELHVNRGGEPVAIRAQHADFERGDLVCHLREAIADFHKGEAKAGEAKVLFRQDGSAMRLDASGGFEIATPTGAHLAAPNAVLEFDEHNQPRQGRMEGGVALDSVQNGRVAHGSAPTADLAFAGGELRHAHLERGVQIHTDQQTQGNSGPVHTLRDWRSPVLDVTFRHSYASKVELASMHGTGGVVVTGLIQQANGPAMPSRMAADTVTADFGDGQQLTRLLGEGHAMMEQTAKSGVHQTRLGDRLEAWFVPGAGRPSSGTKGKHADAQSGAEFQVESATIDGHVVVTQRGIPKAGGRAQSFRATAAHALYEGADEMVHLSGSPRIEDVGFQLAADRIDVSQASGDAFAHGDVKATWLDSGNGKQGGQGSLALGGQGPAHVVAAEAQLHKVTDEVTFRGQARLWQQANSVSAPVIVLDRTRQTLVARTASASDPVRLILLSAGGIGNPGEKKGAGEKSPSVIRVRAGDFKYSDAERKVVLHAGANGNVIAETETVTTTSNEVQLLLLPPGNHAGKDGGAAQVDRLTAKGRVVISSMGRRGTGEQLVYTSESENYVLTGTAAAPPRMTDAARGTVTGEALIFNSRDDSVSVEGDGRKTVTETTVPR
jgi:lipopolysaccharide export system protein LptA